MKNSCAIILAAGEGSRMKSDKPKTLLKVLDKPMIGWVLDSVKNSGISKICVIIGHGYSCVQDYLLEFSSNSSIDLTTVFQDKRLGTGHAVLTAENFLKSGNFEDTSIFSGDSPLLDSKTIINAYLLHKKENNSATLISSKIEDPFGYGRIIRKNGKICAIKEQKDANKEILKIKEINSGAYWFNTKSLISILRSIDNNNAQNEYYLTDAIRLLIEKNKKVGSFSCDSPDLTLGANNKTQLEKINEAACRKILEKCISSGVEIPNVENVIIGPDVEFGSNCRVLCNTIILGKSKIGNNCTIGPDVSFKDKEIENNNTVTKVKSYFYNISNYKNQLI
ncbi:MAG: NTP transferase domain-containing protein [Oscillospiraceae bacterium]|jgi:bifunctional UDP-N-acetylglucosamine pyrophosphorylase/glucosamine-1-phosphate N-acetyltransferase|nr:NTP transferase domain-containing protein [Oscillospiraceae bacterium]